MKLEFEKDEVISFNVLTGLILLFCTILYMFTGCQQNDEQNRQHEKWKIEHSTSQHHLHKPEDK